MNPSQLKERPSRRSESPVNRNKQTSVNIEDKIAHSSGAIEYTDCFSAEG